jgi:hypothetical protein
MTSVIKPAAVSSEEMTLAIGRGNKRYPGYRMLTVRDWEKPENRGPLIESYFGSGWKFLENLTLSDCLVVVDNSFGINVRLDNYVIREEGFNRGQSFNEGESYIMANYVLRFLLDPTTKFCAPKISYDNDFDFTGRPCLFIKDPNHVRMDIVQVGKGNTEYPGFRKVTPYDFKAGNMVNKMMSNYNDNDCKWFCLEPLPLTSESFLCIKGALLIFKCLGGVAQKIVSLPESNEPVTYYSPHLLNTNKDGLCRTTEFNELIYPTSSEFYFIPFDSKDSPYKDCPCLFVRI